MKAKEKLQFDVLMAARDNGISSIIFRNAMAKKFGLNLTESLAITLLGINSVSTPTDLSKFIGLTTGATTTLIDRLEKKNIIRRKANPNDRRGTIIEVTEEYSKKAQKLVAGIAKANQELISQYSDKELKVIADFLNKFTNNITNQTKEIEKVSL